MIHAWPLVLPAALALQGPAGPAPRPDSDRDGWTLVDGIAFQAGDSIVTIRQLNRHLEEELKDVEISTAEEYEAQLRRVLRERIAQELETQAGEDLEEIDPARVHQAVLTEAVDKQRELGVAAWAESVVADRGSTWSELDAQAEELYQTSWRLRVTGARSISGLRPTTDHYVRPGELRAIYDARREELADPTLVRLQICDLIPAAFGGSAAARDTALDVVERSRDGEPFEGFVREFGAGVDDDLGVTPDLALQQLQHPAMRRFAESAALDEISDPIEVLGPDGELLHVLVAKLLARREGGPPPEFSSPLVQRFLRREFLRGLEDERLEEARRDLEMGAFLWFAPGLGGPDPVLDPAPGAVPAPVLAPAPGAPSSAPGAGSAPR